MSTKYPGGIITKNYTPPTTSSASGIWTLDQQDQAQQAGIWPFGGPFNYIEDVFSTWLSTGNNATQTFVTGVNLLTYGGMWWSRSRNNSSPFYVYDTVRGATTGTAASLATTSTAGQNTSFPNAVNVTTTGFTVADNSNEPGYINATGSNDVYYSFRKQAKFFDVVTYTGTGSAQTINHNLGSAPGSIIIKQTSGAGGTWWVWHTATNTYVYRLNTTDSQIAWGTLFNGVQPTSTSFQVGANGNSNANGETYVAYLFASNAGGFGLTGTDNVIKCGSYTQSTGQIVNLGFEPQWIMIKRIDGTSNWVIEDVMRGESYSQGQQLYPNLSSSEVGAGPDLTPTATGFIDGNALSGTVIYIAIRRGPMKVPTDATTVFAPVAQNGGSMSVVTTGFPVDLTFLTQRSGGYGYGTLDVDRLRGSLTDNVKYLTTQTTSAETQIYSGVGFASNTSIIDQLTYGQFGTTSSVAYWNFRRAPSFFDEVCYTGNGSTQTITHNLGVVPELIIAKNRGQAGNNWPVLFNFASTTMNYGFLNLTNSCPNDTYANVGVFSASPTSTQMFLVSSGSMNGSGYGIVAYLFATCAGVSKVGTYTGNGTTQAIACGFTGGARFVLIKRTDSTGDWYVYDTARGMTTLTDPYLLLDTADAEVATLGSVTTTTGGFTVNAAILAAINTSSATYIFLAIA